jgi:hypothetical protein
MALQNREKKMLMFAGPVAVLLLVLNFMGVFGGKSKSSGKAVERAKAKVSRVANAVAGKESAATTSRAASGFVRYDSWGDRDPFTKPVFRNQPAPSAPIHVKGIVWKNGKPYVLINDVVLAVGEEKDGIRVDRIEGKKVFCRKGGSMYTLQWSESP